MYICSICGIDIFGNGRGKITKYNEKTKELDIFCDWCTGIGSNKASDSTEELILKNFQGKTREKLLSSHKQNVRRMQKKYGSRKA